MKIQCACGTKYAFDVTVEMVHSPILFVCPSCGQDSSEAVNQAIRQQFATEAASVPAAPPASAPAGSPAIRLREQGVSSTPAAGPSALVPPPGSSGLRVARAANASAPEEPVPTESALAAPRLCSKHPGQQMAHTCLVCGKPMCAQCMAVFGFLCSAYCQTKAEAQGMEVPVYQFKKSLVDRRRWRKVGLVAGSIAAVLLAVFGFWFWYAWFGSVPAVAYAHRFQDPGYSGQLHLAANDQLVVLHGGTLTRHDLVAGRKVWSLELLDKARIASDSAVEMEQMIKAKQLAVSNGADPGDIRLPQPQELIEQNTRAAAADYQLAVSGENVWLISSGKLTHYAWADGRPDKELSAPDDYDDLRRTGGELLFVSDEDGPEERVVRVDLASGESRTESRKPLAATLTLNSRNVAKTEAVLTAGAPRANEGATTKPLDPTALATRAQNLPLPARLALPATVAVAANQQRLAAALNDQDDELPVAVRSGGRKFPASEIARRIRTADGAVEFATRMLEEKIVVREAMKAPPKKSALEGTVNAAATMEIANELLNEIQRDRGGSTVEEDESRYQVTVRRPGKGVPEWTGEMIGAPAFHPLPSIDVVTAGKSMVVLDKSNKKLWDSKLNYEVIGGGVDEPLEEGKATLGAGPCVERGDTLYLFDQGVVTSFAKSTGTVNWRLPSIGTVGLWFDEEGMLYLNTTTASPGSIKYSRQIDLSEKTHGQVLKIDPQSGKTLWTAANEGFVSYIWSKYVYTLESHTGDDEDDGALGVKTGFEIPSHIRIKRLDASNGRVLWQHYQMRAPLDVRFDKNRIQLLFKREVQFLKFVVL